MTYVCYSLLKSMFVAKALRYLFSLLVSLAFKILLWMKEDIREATQSIDIPINANTKLFHMLVSGVMLLLSLFPHFVRLTFLVLLKKGAGKGSLASPGLCWKISYTHPKWAIPELKLEQERQQLLTSAQGITPRHAMERLSPCAEIPAHSQVTPLIRAKYKFLELEI